VTNPLKIRQVLPLIEGFPDRVAMPHGPWPSDEGVPGGGVAFPIDTQMADSRPTVKLSEEEEKRLTDIAMGRTKKEGRQRTFHLTLEQVKAGKGTLQGDEDGEE